MTDISLPIVDRPEYISPTAFKVWKTCAFKYYLKYLTGKKYTFQQTPAMAMGSLFDAVIKSRLAAELQWYNKDTTLSLGALLKNVDSSMMHLLPEARRLVDYYIASGAYKALLDEVISGIEYDELKHVKANKYHIAFPIYGKPDLKIGHNIITDFKVNGYGSKSGQSPKQGYKRAFDKNGEQGPHEKYGITMPEIDIDWATQLTIYNWLEQDQELLDLSKDIPVAIEQIAIRGTTTKIASFRAIVPVAFQTNLYNELKTMWESILDGKIEKPKPSSERCFPYRTKCEVAQDCNAFQKVFNDNDFNKMLGIKV